MCVLGVGVISSYVLGVTFGSAFWVDFLWLLVLGVTFGCLYGA